MAGAIGDGHDGESDQRADLNDVNAHIDRRCAIDTPIGDIADQRLRIRYRKAT